MIATEGLTRKDIGAMVKRLFATLEEGEIYVNNDLIYNYGTTLFPRGNTNQSVTIELVPDESGTSSRVITYRVPGYDAEKPYQTISLRLNVPFNRATILVASSEDIEGFVRENPKKEADFFGNFVLEQKINSSELKKVRAELDRI